MAKVRITAGTNNLSKGTLDNPLGGGADLVVMDDFVYGEPVKLTDRVVLAGSGEVSAPVVNTLRSDGSQARSDAAFDGSQTGGVRVAAGDVTGDGVLDEIVGSGPGSASLVRILDGKTGQERTSIHPFEETFTGGVFVAAADFTGDGLAEVIISPDQGGGPRIRVYNGSDFAVLADFFGIQDPDFRGGARTAAGDLSGDGIPDLLVAAGFGGGPRLAAFDGAAVLNPLPADTIFKFIEKRRNIVVAELNYTGQMAQRLRAALNIQVESFTKCTGQPFTPYDLLKHILALHGWDDNRSEPVQMDAQAITVNCPCDWNNSGAITVQDIFDFLISYFAGNADFNHVGGTTVQDIFDFLICYFNGCP